MDLNIKFSIIVPIYNIANYITDCVCSILVQTIGNFELILVDDGSKDDSPRICDEYARKDNRVKVIHKQNGGLSDARNTGLLTASGDYVIFLDGDDFWQFENGLQVLMDEVRKTPECDFIGFNCSYYYPSTKKFKKWVKLDETLCNLDSKGKCIASMVKSGTFPMSACFKLIKRDFLLQNRILFQKDLYSEDIPWFIELLTKASCFRFTNHYIYAYRKEVTGSISSSFSEKKFSDLLYIVNSGIENVNKMEASEQLKYSLLSFWAYEYCILSGECLCFERSKRKEYQDKLYRLDWLMEYTENPKVKKVCLVRKLLGWSMTKRLMHLYITKVLWK